MTMKAVRFHGKEDIRIEQVPIPTCGKGQVKLKPSFVGICGSDLHEYLGGASIIPTTPHPITKEKVPITLGHEFSGVIEEVGEDITDLKPGARVTVQPIIYDSTCPACKEGYINCCEQNGFVGLSGWGGGLSEHVVLPRKSVYEIPESMSMEVAALIEPLAVGWHAVKISPFAPALPQNNAPSTVLILGGGPIGLAVIQALKAKTRSASSDSASPEAPEQKQIIIVSEISPARQKFATHFGATHVLNPLSLPPSPDRSSSTTLADEVKKICGGVGVDLVFDAAGVQSALDAAVQCLKPRGTLVNIAVWEQKATIWPSDFLFRERKYMGVATYQEGDYREVLDAIEGGRMEPGEMISKRIKMEDVVGEGFESLRREKDVVKVLIDLT